MSYNISFKAKLEGVDEYGVVGDCCANITWNVRKIIELSTGLPWINEENNGKCVDVMSKIRDGYRELCDHPEKYKKYEDASGWGTVRDVKDFFWKILCDWTDLCQLHPNVVRVATFWIE